MTYRQHDLSPNPNSVTIPIRTVTLLDDLDQIGGNDILTGSTGDDVIYGQHGDDQIDGGDGNDELFGDEGSDMIYGDDGYDVILGDSGFVVKKVLSSTEFVDHYEYDGIEVEDGPDISLVHRDIVLEETVQITQVIPISIAQTSSFNSLATSILGSDYVLLAGAYTIQEGLRYTDNNVWRTYAVLAITTPGQGQDFILGGSQNDIIIGQRDADIIGGDDDDDLVIGDSANIAESFSSQVQLNWPKIYNTLRCFNSSVLNITSKTGAVVHVPFTVSLNFFVLFFFLFFFFF
jgi:Ca2+-binding RTX toxin-like protein